jgi:hypothetical protein
MDLFVSLLHVYIKSYYCPRCFTNQIRVAHSGDEKVDWRKAELNVDQSRDKKLKELGL